MSCDEEVADAKGPGREPDKDSDNDEVDIDRENNDGDAADVEVKFKSDRRIQGENRLVLLDDSAAHGATDESRKEESETFGAGEEGEAEERMAATDTGAVEAELSEDARTGAIGCKDMASSP